jgi:hypothetical protein
MDSYSEIPLRRKAKRHKTKSKSKFITKPKKQYLPSRGYKDDFSVEICKGIANSPETVVKTKTAPKLIIKNKPTVITSTFVNKDIQWSDIVKYGVDNTEWNFVEDIFVMEL